MRLNFVAPGYFDTGRIRQRIEALTIGEGLDRDSAIERIANATPLVRIGDAEELADAVDFIVSHRVRYLNGTTIVVDGGSGRIVT
ncbi:SDR family oxidoreductase [Bradyrhizobium sp. 160]|nr:SDR family oxidoreductase [Bradyrhizobium sp. 160]